MTTPDFETLYGPFEATLLTDAYQAITVCGLWDWLRTFSPEEGKGFMFSGHPNLDRIGCHTEIIRMKTGKCAQVGEAHQGQQQQANGAP